MLISAIDLGTRKLWSAKVCYLVNYILQVVDLKGGKRMGPIVRPSTCKCSYVTQHVHVYTCQSFSAPSELILVLTQVNASNMLCFPPFSLILFEAYNRF